MSASRLWTTLALAIALPCHAQVAPALLIKPYDLMEHGAKYHGTRVRIDGLSIMNAHKNIASAWLTSDDFAIIDIRDVPPAISRYLRASCSAFLYFHLVDPCRFNLEADVWISPDGLPFLRRTTLVAAPLSD